MIMTCKMCLNQQQLFLKRSMKAPPHNFKEAQTSVQFLLGPVKIKDGLFMGDQFAAKDIEFIISNKVTHIVNTVSKSLPNLYERFGIQYLSVHWTEHQQNIFDKKNNAVATIFQFIEEAMMLGESCLIHSLHGKSRACAVLVAYLIKKYSWSLNKCLEFVNSKKDGLEIRNNYLSQMQDLERRVMVDSKLSISWNQIKSEEDLVLANTFFNSKKAELRKQSERKPGKKRVKFAQRLTEKPNHSMTPHATGFHIQSNKAHLNKLRSILKGDQQEDDSANFTSPQQKKQVAVDDRFVSSIKGNMVQVPVNNYITTEKTPPPKTSKIYNTRPFSSDNKERDRRARLHPSETSMASTLKNPYESKLVNRGPLPRRREEPRNLMMIYDRPYSAKVSEDRKKGMRHPAHNPLAQKLGYDMMASNSSASKRRPPPSYNQEDPFRWK